jgi:large subunit ribosomal protein L29
MPSRMLKLREMDRDELEARKAELAEDLFRLRFQIASGQMEGLKHYREARRDLARVNTLLGGMAKEPKKEDDGN